MDYCDLSKLDWFGNRREKSEYLPIVNSTPWKSNRPTSSDGMKQNSLKVVGRFAIAAVSFTCLSASQVDAQPLDDERFTSNETSPQNQEAENNVQSNAADLTKNDSPPDNQPPDNQPPESKLPESEPIDAQVLIEQLADQSYAQREYADELLRQRIDEVFPVIEDRLKTSVGEVRSRLSMILMDIVRGELPSKHAAQASSLLTQLAEHGTGIQFHRLHESLKFELGAIAFQRITQLNPTPRYMFNSKSIELRVDYPLYVSPSFQGTAKDLDQLSIVPWVYFARLEGPKIDRAILEATLKLPNLTHLQLFDTELTADDLKLLETGPVLNTFEIIYSPVGGELLDILPNLPVSESMFVYGTQLTNEEIAEIPNRITDLEVFLSRGAHLGLYCNSDSLVIDRVMEDSAAEKAGLQFQDKIKSVNGIELTTFGDLLRELAKFAPGDTAKVEYYRQVPIKDAQAPDKNVPLEDDILPRFRGLRFKQELMETQVTFGRRHQ